MKTTTLISYVAVGAVSLGAATWTLRGPASEAQPAAAARAPERSSPQTRPRRGGVGVRPAGDRRIAAESDPFVELSSELVTDGAAASPSETQIVAGLERELADDDRDAAWAREIESQAADALASYEGQRVLTIECRSRLCRMEIASDDLARQDELLADLALTPPFNTEGFVHVLDEPEVEPRFVAYFAREGQSLPSSLDAS